MAYKNLDYALHAEGISQKDFARIIGVSEKTAYNKINGKCPFTVPEYKKTCTLFPKYDKNWLFDEG